ncbi:hypothetical protein [Chelativorans salis]|uniref:Uncharacterized protein n=1 Tax=Chelativorans salis TaxID=2978478 RepID=A0ABT2LNV9_9HYPH|nr:hypothetical protein [Chelativorans sp. EGI FJ00035]MCT7375976.1 hypothetical protein [Chelativorans sp. EGI FJ00035]
MPDATTLAQPGTSELPQVRRGSRTRLVRRVILFQVKLFADGLRDFVMSPLSIVAGVLGLFSRDPEGAYDRLMQFGRDTDRWINLFDAYGAQPGGQGPTLDAVADEIETAIRRDYADGGVSARSAEAMLGLARQLRRRR